ncbi:MAG: methylmalonyl-CoA epimerase [Rhodothermales bacterium]|nr:methylmalonyl-CoA epimerase [Rhodothermales bacterium]
MTRVEHIGIAVNDVDALASLLNSLLGLRIYKTETVEREGVRTHFLDGGGAKIELLESLADDSPVGRFLEKRGQGVHHIAFEVHDVQETIDRGRELGLQPLTDHALEGADGKRIAFFHPRDTYGILIEVCETVAFSKG